MDVSEFKRIQLELEAQALRDTLTGLPNRRAFNMLLAPAIGRCYVDAPMAVMFIDLDFFKQINDAMGHGAGDAVLKEFAQRLSRAVRSTDVTARMSGDEFVVLLEAAGSIVEVARIAAKICASVRQPMLIGDAVLSVSASVGVVFNARQANATAPALLAAADGALYQAKNAGRNTFTVVELEPQPTSTVSSSLLPR